jgi:hypothetical protein
MNKLLLTSAVLFGACGIWSCQGRIKKPDAASVQGCISRSGSDYVLTENSGRKYVLTGNTGTLGQQVGHEILVRGLMVKSDQAPQAPPEASGGVRSQIDVASVQPVADKCK